MKNKYLLSTCLILIFFSCKVGFDEGKVEPKRTAPRSASTYNREAPKTIKVPLLNGGVKDVDVVQGRYIVKTVKDFDKSVFVKMGARILSAKRFNQDYVFWHVYKNDSFFLKKVLKLEGVLSAEYDFAVHHIRPPKNGTDDLKPKPESEKDEDGRILKPMGLEDGNTEKDPRTNEVNYSLKITHALEAYKKFKNEQFQKPVLLGIVDTGFNYCNEDFWFKNSKDQMESVAYFIKSPYLPGIASRDFDVTIDAEVDENNPDIPYAKDFLEKYKFSGRMFEVPCTKVGPSLSKPGYGSPDCAFFWNWDNLEHGTHCSGIMAAVGDNDKGVAGVSWKNTKIASYKCFGGTSTGWEIYGALADYAEYIKHGKAGTLNELYPVVDSFNSLGMRDGVYTGKAEHPYESEQQKFEPYKDQGVYPINLSLGGPFPNEFMATVLMECLKQGVLPVVAMGNDGQRLPEFPASFEGVLAVGATDGMDRRKHFSCSGEWIDICAPGDGILSTGINPGHNHPWYVQPIPDTRLETFLPWNHKDLSKCYTTMSGTSMATPFMTGVLGYLLSFEKARGKDAGWLKSVVQSTADSLIGQVAGQHTEEYGYGRVNVLKAGEAVVTGKVFAGDPTWDYNANHYVTIKLKNKRCSAPDSNANVPESNDLGLSGHTVVVYEENSGNPRGFNMTNGKGEASFFFLPKGKSYVARANIDGGFYEASFVVQDKEQVVMLEFDSARLYISTINPHSSVFEKYSPNGEYNNDVDTIITIYEDGNFDEPIDRFDYNALDIMAFYGKSGKTYFAEVTCYADPTTGNYRTGIYGFRIGYDSLPSTRKGCNDFINPAEVDVGVKQPTTGQLVYELKHGWDCWEPNDSFEEARQRGCFIDFAKNAKKGEDGKMHPLKSYVVCCLTNQSDGLDRDIFMFKVPEWDEE